MKSVRMVVNKLITDACIERCCGADGSLFERMRRRDGYANIPDRYKPGAVIKRLSAEDRETVQRATEKDFYHRFP